MVALKTLKVFVQQAVEMSVGMYTLTGVKLPDLKAVVVSVIVYMCVMKALCKFSFKLTRQMNGSLTLL